MLDRPFQNLYVLSKEFRDYNLSLMLDTLSYENEARLELLFNMAYGPESDFDPELEDLIECTLSKEACAGYMRRTREPIIERDYYLSKLYQFIWMPVAAKLNCGGMEGVLLEGHRHAIEAGLSSALDKLGDGEKVALSFDWKRLYYDLSRTKPERVLSNLLSYFFAEPERRRETPKQVIDRQRGTRSIERIALEAGLDPKQVYKVCNGERVQSDTLRKLATTLCCSVDQLMPDRYRPRNVSANRKRS